MQRAVKDSGGRFSCGLFFGCWQEALSGAANVRPSEGLQTRAEMKRHRDSSESRGDVVARKKKEKKSNSCVQTYLHDGVGIDLVSTARSLRAWSR